ncbi:MAG TPA: hypothetical protein DDZ88_13500 [Verrucomicrobiales bacterium]|nr:hypothetical protein [Verrucomicrobiales bacterium]
MPKPISRRELIRRLKLLGWSGPYGGGKHMNMVNSQGRPIPIPNPHGGDIDWSLTKRILQQAGIDPNEWDKLA